VKVNDNLLMTKKHNFKKKVNNKLPFKYKGKLRPDEFFRKCEEAIRLHSKRLSYHRLTLARLISLLYIKYSNKKLRISQIYFIIDIEAFKLSCFIDFGPYKLREIETERKNIKSILYALVKENLIYKNEETREYRNYYEIIFLGNDEERLKDTIKESFTVSKKSNNFHNILIDSKIPISKEGYELINYELKAKMKKIIQKAEEETINENLNMIKNGSNELHKEIPFRIIHKVLNEFL
jgi:hypothetical protein